MFKYTLLFAIGIMLCLHGVTVFIKHDQPLPAILWFTAGVVIFGFGLRIRRKA